MPLFIVSLLAVGLAVLLLAVGIIFKKNGRFPNTHVGGSKAMQARGISCHTSQHKEAQLHRSLAERVAPRARARAAGEELSARAHETVDSLRARAESLRERARDHLERAQDGDAESIRVVAAVAGGVVAGAALLGVLIGRSRG